jgi:hypothetical protein
MNLGEEVAVAMKEIKEENWLINSILNLCSIVGFLVAVITFWNVGGIICDWWITNGLAFLTLSASTIILYTNNEGSTSLFNLSLFGWTLSSVFAPRLF